MNGKPEEDRKPDHPGPAAPGGNRAHAVRFARSGETAQLADAARHLSVWLVTVALSAVPPVAVGANVDDRAPGGFWTPERKTLALNSGIVAGVTVYGFTVWDWGKSGFAFESEGWFGRDTASGGADKLGHAFTGAATTALGAALYRRWGYDEAQAAVLGAMSGLLLTTAVEVGDGFSPDHGFSWEDQVANMAGVGLEYLRQRYPLVRERVQFRWEYFPSRAMRAGRHDDILTDYSGSRWLLAFPLRAWGANDSALRWFEVQIGYGTRGFSARDRDQFPQPKRHPYVGIGIHVPLVLESLGARRGVSRSFEYLQIPGTALPLPP